MNNEKKTELIQNLKTLAIEDSKQEIQFLAQHFQDDVALFGFNIDDYVISYLSTAIDVNLTGKELLVTCSLRIVELIDYLGYMLFNEEKDPVVATRMAGGRVVLNRDLKLKLVDQEYHSFRIVLPKRIITFIQRFDHKSKLGEETALNVILSSAVSVLRYLHEKKEE